MDVHIIGTQHFLTYINHIILNKTTISYIFLVIQYLILMDLNKKNAIYSYMAKDTIVLFNNKKPDKNSFLF